MTTATRTLQIISVACLAGLAACTTVDRNAGLGCEVEPVAADWNPVVAPHYYPDRVDAFSASLQHSSSDIELVDSAFLWKAVFGKRAPDADVNVSEFQHSDIAINVAAEHIRYVIVLDTLPDTVADDDNWTMVSSTQQEVSTQGAVLMTFTGVSCERDRYIAQAEGRDDTGWLYLGYHFDDDSPNEALKAVTDRMTEVMLEQSPELPVKVVVLAARPSQPSQPSLP